jgi:hypothetical protein
MPNVLQVVACLPLIEYEDLQMTGTRLPISEKETLKHVKRTARGRASDNQGLEQCAKRLHQSVAINRFAADEKVAFGSKRDERPMSLASPAVPQ